MKLKIDENISRHLKPALARLGHDVATAHEEGLLSMPDEVVAQAARQEDRMLLTLDLDFADLRKYNPGDHPGVILFRPARFGAQSVSAFVEHFVRETRLDEFVGCLVIVEADRVRTRRPEPPGKPGA